MRSRLAILSFAPIFCLGIFLVCGQSVAGSVNYCHDPETNSDWERLAHQNSEPEIKELYAMRKELCQKVEDGELELDAAIDIFETQRQIKIQSILQRKMRTNSAASSG